MNAQFLGASAHVHMLKKLLTRKIGLKAWKTEFEFEKFTKCDELQSLNPAISLLNSQPRQLQCMLMKLEQCQFEPQTFWNLEFEVDLKGENGKFDFLIPLLQKCFKGSNSFQMLFGMCLKDKMEWFSSKIGKCNVQFKAWFNGDS